MLEKEGFSHFRGVRGDGNCYYRSVANGYVEFLAMKRNLTSLRDFVSWVSDSSYGNYYFIDDDHKNYRDAI